VEGYRPDVVLIVMPFMNTDWYLPQLRRQYPDLVIPLSRYDGTSGTMKRVPAECSQWMARSGFGSYGVRRSRRAGRASTTALASNFIHD